MGTGTFPGVRRPGRDTDHQPPSSAEVKRGVPLLPRWNFMASYRVNFSFFFTDLEEKVCKAGLNGAEVAKVVGSFKHGNRTCF